MDNMDATVGAQLDELERLTAILEKLMADGEAHLAAGRIEMAASACRDAAALQPRVDDLVSSIAQTLEALRAALA